MNLGSIQRIWIRAKNPHSQTQEWQKNLEKGLSEEGFELSARLKANTDLCLSLGGDGSLLSAIREIHGAGRSVPVLGLHTSPGLGFLPQLRIPTDKPKAFVKEIARHLRKGAFEIEERLGLEASTESENFWALNDIVLGKGTLSRMVGLEVQVDGSTLFSRLRGDGLIISSATGSTAYSLSAGGPIMHPAVKALIMTPICPHNVSQRPLILPDTSKIRVKVLELKGPCFLTADGQKGRELRPGETLEIRQASTRVPWMKLDSSWQASRHYFETLQSKLGLGRS